MAWGEIIIPSWLLKQSFSKLHNSKALPKNFGWNWMLQGALWLKASASDYTVPEKSCRYLGSFRPVYKNAHLMHMMVSKHQLSMYTTVSKHQRRILDHDTLTLTPLGSIWGARILAVSSILSSPPSAASQYPSSLLHSTSPLSEMNKVFVLNFRIENLDLFRENIPDRFQHLAKY